MENKQIETSSYEELNKKENSNPKEHKVKLGFVFIALTLVFVVIGIVLFVKGIDSAAISLINSYNNSKEEKYYEVSNKIYNEVFDKTEEYYHVSVDSNIKIEDLQEMSNLEVLKLNTTAFSIKNKDNESDIISWMQFTGEGTYVVDMTYSEFITDTQRSYTLVRAPKPKLTNISIVDNKSIFYKDASSIIIFNGSEKEGNDIYDKQYTEGYEKIKKELTENQTYYYKAKESAVKIITNLVKGLNPELKDLKVDVEFFD